MKPSVRAKVERLARESPVPGERAAALAALRRDDQRIELARGKPGFRDYRPIWVRYPPYAVTVIKNTGFYTSSISIF